MNNQCKLPEQSEHLIELKDKIVPKIKEYLQTPFVNFQPTGWKRIETPVGFAFINVVYWSKDIAISLNTASSGTMFPKHQHPGREIFIVYKGYINLFIGDKKEVKINNSGKPHYFDATQPHSAIFDVDSEYVAISMPGDENWLK